MDAEGLASFLDDSLGFFQTEKRIVIFARCFDAGQRLFKTLLCSGKVLFRQLHFTQPQHGSLGAFASVLNGLFPIGNGVRGPSELPIAVPQ